MVKEFVKATVIRAVWTVSQTAIATIGTAKVIGQVDWKFVGSSVFLSGLLSVLKSIAVGLPEVKGGYDEPEI